MGELHGVPLVSDGVLFADQTGFMRSLIFVAVEQVFFGAIRAKFEPVVCVAAATEKLLQDVRFVYHGSTAFWALADRELFKTVAAWFDWTADLLLLLVLTEARKTEPLVALELLGGPLVGVHGGSTDEAGNRQRKLSFFARAFDIVKGLAHFAKVNGRDFESPRDILDRVAAIHQGCGEAVRGVQLIASVAIKTILPHTFAHSVTGRSRFGIHRFVVVVVVEKFFYCFMRASGDPPPRKNAIGCGLSMRAENTNKKITTTPQDE